jgi:hypothetical protein
MTFEIAFVLALVVLAVILFATEKLPVDLVALLVMVSGIISPEEGIAGFSNTATVTVSAMFVLSAGTLLNLLFRFLAILLIPQFWPFKRMSEVRFGHNDFSNFINSCRPSRTSLITVRRKAYEMVLEVGRIRRHRRLRSCDVFSHHHLDRRGALGAGRQPGDDALRHCIHPGVVWLCGFARIWPRAHGKKVRH